MAENTAADLEASAALTLAADRTSLCGPDVVVFNHKGPSVARTEIKLFMPGSEIIYGSVGGDFLWQCPNYDQTRKPVLEFLKGELFMSLHELSAPTILHSQLIVTAAQKIIENKQEDCFQAPNLAWGTSQIKLTNTPRGFRVDFKGDNWIVFNNFVMGRVVVPGTTRELVNFYSVSTRKTYKCVVETANQCYPRMFENEENPGWKIYAKAMSRVLELVSDCEADFRQCQQRNNGCEEMSPEARLAMTSARLDGALWHVISDNEAEYKSTISKLENQLHRMTDRRLRNLIRKNIEALRKSLHLLEGKNKPNFDGLMEENLHRYVQSEIEKGAARNVTIVTENEDGTEVEIPAQLYAATQAALDLLENSPTIENAEEKEESKETTKRQGEGKKKKKKNKTKNKTKELQKKQRGEPEASESPKEESVNILPERDHGLRAADSDTQQPLLQSVAPPQEKVDEDEKSHSAASSHLRSPPQSPNTPTAQFQDDESEQTKSTPPANESSPFNPQAPSFVPTAPSEQRRSAPSSRHTSAAGYDFDDFKVICNVPGCNQLTRSFDGQSVICPWCGPFRLVRYCNILHLLADVGSHFYSNRCRAEYLRLPEKIRWSSLDPVRHLNSALQGSAMGPAVVPSERHMAILTAYKSAGLFYRLTAAAMEAEAALGRELERRRTR